jgi:hypothetical protein
MLSLPIYLILELYMTDALAYSPSKPHPFAVGSWFGKNIITQAYNHMTFILNHSLESQSWITVPNHSPGSQSWITDLGHMDHGLGSQSWITVLDHIVLNHSPESWSWIIIVLSQPWITVLNHESWSSNQDYESRSWVIVQNHSCQLWLWIMAMNKYGYKSQITV